MTNLKSSSNTKDSSGAPEESLGELTTAKDTEDALKISVMQALKSIKMVGDAAAEKLYEAGYYSVDDIAATSLGDLIEKTGMTKTTAEVIIKNAIASTSLGTPATLSEMPDVSNGGFLSTGSKAVDEMLGGGYQRGIITEWHGPGGLGKTQSVMTAAVIATQPVEAGGIDSDVLYVDTEGSFTKERIIEIAKARGIDPATVVNRVHLYRCMSSASQILMLQTLDDWNQQWKLGLIVVDSAIANLRTEYVGRGTLQERQGLLNRFLHALSLFARRNNSIIIVTNQMVTSPAIMYGDPELPTGGLVFNHACQCRLRIRGAKDPKRVIRLVKDCWRPTGETVAAVTAKGLTDSE